MTTMCETEERAMLQQELDSLRMQNTALRVEVKMLASDRETLKIHMKSNLAEISMLQNKVSSGFQPVVVESAKRDCSRHMRKVVYVMMVSVFVMLVLFCGVVLSDSFKGKDIHIGETLFKI